MENILNIVDELCMNYCMKNNELNMRKCLTYIDEFEDKFEDSKKVISLVSFTALMEHYIKQIEKRWLTEIREQFGFKMGTPIHFTKLRTIAQMVKYENEDGDEITSIGWNDEYVLYRSNRLIDYEQRKFKANVKGRSQRDFVEEYRVWKLFRKQSEDTGRGVLDFNKLENFYEKVLSIIRESNFKILCTSVIYDTKAKHRNIFKSEQIKSPHMIAFSEHLDLLCFYLKHGFMDQEELDQGGRLYQGSFSSKLRWDGDDGFNQKQDYRLLFNKAVSLGTTHFQSETVRKCLDEIRFINKHEIGYYDDLEEPNLVSHIGCEIADFIAYYVGKYSVKDKIIHKLMAEGKNEQESELEFLNTVTFKIKDREFNPYEEAIKDKIITTQEYKSVQVIKECHYNNL